MPIKKNILIFVLKMKEIYILKLCYTHDLKKKVSLCTKLYYMYLKQWTLLLVTVNPSFFLTSIPFKRND